MKLTNQERKISSLVTFSEFVPDFIESGEFEPDFIESYKFYIFAEKYLLNEKNYILSPANKLVFYIIEQMKLMNFSIPRIYDDNKKEFNTEIISLNEITEKKVFILALSQKYNIANKIKKEYGENLEVVVLDVEENFYNTELKRKDFFKLIRFSQRILLKNELYENTKEKTYLFVMDNNFADMPYKVNIIAKELSAKVFWVGKTPHIFPENLEIEINKINFIQCLGLIHKLKKRNKIVFLSSAVYSGYVQACFIKEIFKYNIRYILYIYDFLPLICSLPYFSQLSEYLNSDINKLKSEYYYANKIVYDDILDGLIFKDGNSEFINILNTSTPSICFPAFPTKKNFLIQSEEKEFEELKLLHIGTLLSAETEPEVIYGNNFYTEFFKSLINKKINLDMCYMTDTSQKASIGYKTILGEQSNINFLKIDSINKEIVKFRDYNYGIIPFIENENVLASNLHYTSIPSKFFTYISLGLPVITHKGFNTISKLVHRYNIGMVVEDFRLLDTKQLRKNYSEYEKNVIKYRDTITLENKKIKLSSFILDVFNKDGEVSRYIQSANKTINKINYERISNERVKLDDKVYITSEKINDFEQAKFICDILLNNHSIYYLQIYYSVELEILIEKNQLNNRVKILHNINPIYLMDKVFCFFFFEHSYLYEKCIKQNITYFIPPIVNGSKNINISELFLYNNDIIKLTNECFNKNGNIIDGFELFKSIYWFDEEDTKELFNYKNDTLYNYYLKIFNLCLSNLKYWERFKYATKVIDNYYFNKNHDNKVTENIIKLLK